VAFAVGAVILMLSGGDGPVDRDPTPVDGGDEPIPW
jgi:hypothetical protein